MEKAIQRIRYILLLFLFVFGGVETEKLADYIYLVVLPTVVMLIALLILCLAQRMHVPRTPSQITDRWALKKKEEIIKNEKVNLKFKIAKTMLQPLSKMIW